MYSLPHYIIVVCDMVIFDWMETIHTDVIYDDDGHLDCPHHLTIPAVARIDQCASAQAGCDFCFNVSANASSLFKIFAASIVLVNTSNIIWLLMVTPASSDEPSCAAGAF